MTGKIDLPRAAISLSLFFALFNGALVAQAAAPVPVPLLEPDGKWQVDYGVSECLLLRRFGTKDSASIVQIQRGLHPDLYSWAIYSKEIPAFTKPTKISVQLHPPSSSYQFTSNPYAEPKFPGPMLFWVDDTAAMTRSISDDSQLHIAGTAKLDIRLHFTEVALALKALGKCQDSLAEEWGVNLDIMRAVKTAPEPIGNAGRWVTNNDYTADDKRKKKEGVTGFLLNISADGKTTSCRIIGSSGFESLDKKACELMLRRAIFQPALDAAGNPVASYYSNRVHWQPPR